MAAFVNEQSGEIRSEVSWEKRMLDFEVYHSPQITLGQYTKTDNFEHIHLKQTYKQTKSSSKIENSTQFNYNSIKQYQFLATPSGSDLNFFIDCYEWLDNFFLGYSL